MYCQMNTSLLRDTMTGTTNCMVKQKKICNIFRFVSLCFVVFLQAYSWLYVHVLMLFKFGQGIVSQLFYAWEFVMLSTITLSQC